MCVYIVQLVRDYIAAGRYTQDIPGRPNMPRGRSDEHLLAVASTPSKHTDVHWFLCNGDDDLQ